MNTITKIKYNYHIFMINFYKLFDKPDFDYWGRKTCNTRNKYSSKLKYHSNASTNCILDSTYKFFNKNN